MPDLSQLVTRIASALQITYTEASVLARRLVPVITVEDLDEIGQSADTATRHCWRFGNESATVGRFSLVGLVNPENSGVRIIVQGFIGRLGVSTVLSAGLDATVAGALAQGRYRDGGPGTPAGQVETDNTAGVTVDDITWLSNTTPQYMEFPVVIQPGSNLRIQGNLANIQVVISYFWKEIKLPTLV